MSVLRVGLIGCGGMGAKLARECHSLDDAEITVVCDLNAEAASALGKEFKAKVFKQYRSLLRSDVDGVIVATPNEIPNQPMGAR